MFPLARKDADNYSVNYNSGYANRWDSKAYELDGRAGKTISYNVNDIRQVSYLNFPPKEKAI
jgi:hypothetical protein